MFNETACHYNAFFMLFDLPLRTDQKKGVLSVVAKEQQELKGEYQGPFLTPALVRPVLVQRGNPELY